MEYAVKIMEKRFIRKEKKVKFVMMERKVFSKVSHDRIVKLFFTFQDNNYLYMVMELCRGGELLDVITWVAFCACMPFCPLAAAILHSPCVVVCISSFFCDMQEASESASSCRREGYGLLVGAHEVLHRRSYRRVGVLAQQCTCPFSSS